MQPCTPPPLSTMHAITALNHARRPRPRLEYRRYRTGLTFATKLTSRLVSTRITRRHVALFGCVPTSKNVQSYRMLNGTSTMCNAIGLVGVAIGYQQEYLNFHAILGHRMTRIEREICTYFITLNKILDTLVGHTYSRFVEAAILRGNNYFCLLST